MKQLSRIKLAGLIVLSTVIGVGPLAQAQIIEIKSMKEITSVVNAKTLLVFDLDNTVVEPVQMLGSDQWFEYMVKGFESTGSAKELAIQKSITFWNEIARHTRIKPVEAITPQIIRQAQLAGIPVLGLTARQMSSAAATEAQLSSIGVDFKLRSVSQTPVFSGSLEGSLLRNGIMYVGPSLTKGTALVGLLKQLKLNPSRVVFVDDKARHTVSVDAALNEAGIENFEFRYGAADPQVQAFDANVANTQLNTFIQFGVILSDDVARRYPNR